jgi:phosphomannomutase
MIQLLRALRKNVAIGFVGGSDFVKISEQLSVGDVKGTRVVSP